MAQPLTVSLPLEISERVRDALRRIEQLEHQRFCDEMARILAIGELWYGIKDDPSFDHFKLADIAPAFKRGVDYLNKCAYIWFHRDRRVAAEASALRTNLWVRNEYEPYRTDQVLRDHQKLLDGRKVRSHTIPTPQKLIDMSGTVPSSSMDLPLGGRIVLGDCLDVLRKLPSQSFHLIYCDPPFGQANTMTEWNVPLDWPAIWPELLRLKTENGVIALHCIEPLTARLIIAQENIFRMKYVWRRPRAANFLHTKYEPRIYCEDVVIFCEHPGAMTFNGQATRLDKPIDRLWLSAPSTMFSKKMKPYKSPGARVRYDMTGPMDFLVFGYDPVLDRLLMKTQKPVALAEHFIKSYSDSGDNVLDFCLGSGTTGVAAIRTGRRFAGIEKSEKHFQIACNRLAPLVPKKDQDEAAD